MDGIPLHGASHAAALATLQQCGHEALFRAEYDVTAPGASLGEEYAGHWVGGTLGTHGAQMRPLSQRAGIHWGE